MVRAVHSRQFGSLSLVCISLVGLAGSPSSVSAHLSMLSIGAARDNGQPSPSVPTLLTIPTFNDGGKGFAKFIVADPLARTAAAWRENLDMADKAGVAPAPSAGYTVSSAIIVE
ncbi:MAG: hypothetical protein H7210_12050, partial [Pyrinomonadaceae bacterium]|nr:hypothetical protein [Phycisphaerales bacterium]